jgi:hypothetical protein
MNLTGSADRLHICRRLRRFHTQTCGRWIVWVALGAPRLRSVRREPQLAQPYRLVVFWFETGEIVVMPAPTTRRPLR